MTNKVYKHKDVYDAIAAANQDGDYPTAQDLADGLDKHICVVNESLYKLSDCGRIRRRPCADGSARWEVATKETGRVRAFVSLSASIKAAVAKANQEGRNPTARELSELLSTTASKVMFSLYRLEDNGEVMRVRDGRPYIRWKAVDTE